MSEQKMDQRAGTNGGDRSDSGSPRQYMEMAKSALRKEAETTKGRIAGRASSLAESLRVAADHLDSRSEDQIARGARYAADEVEELVHAFGSRDVRQIVEEVDSFARRRPALFVGALAVAGFALGRFARSSAADTQPEPPTSPMPPTQS